MVETSQEVVQVKNKMSKWSYFLDFFFEKGTGKPKFFISDKNRLGRKCLARHCGQWMRVLRRYNRVRETGRRYRMPGGYYCEKCGFYAYTVWNDD